MRSRLLDKTLNSTASCFMNNLYIYEYIYITCDRNAHVKIPANLYAVFE